MPLPSLLSLGLAGFIALGVGASAVVVSTHQAPTCEVAPTVTTAASLVSVGDTDGATMPDVFFPTPLKTTGTERLTTSPGSGHKAVDGSTVDFQVSVYLGSTGDFLTSSSYDSREPVRRTIDTENFDFFTRELHCVSAGEKLTMTSTVGEVFGAIPEDEFIQSSSTVVMVIDIQQAYIPRPTGPAALPERGMPQVIDHPDGYHGVSFPMNPAPQNLSTQTVIQGSGAAIEAGDRAVVHFTGVVWETQSLFSSSFLDQFPLTLEIIDGSVPGASNGVISGVYQALVGQRVGSRILAVIPSELGYPAGNEPPGVPPGGTLVYVFDILGIE